MLTNFQHDYFERLFSKHAAITALDGKPVHLASNAKIIWALTSASHQNTRRNPIAANRREAAIERFMQSLPAEGLVFPLNDLGPTPRFADHVIKEISVQSDNAVALSPKNTLVACSTPSVIEAYESLGFRILPMELTNMKNATHSTLRPWDVVIAISEAGTQWRNSATYLKHTHEASRTILERYNLGDRIVEIFADPLLGNEGDLTETRDYSTYGQSFDQGANRKYELLRPHMQPGRIVDIGSAAGALLGEMSRDPSLWESDLYGIEITRAMHQLAERRRADGFFNNENVFLYQRNALAGKLFEDDSIDTTLTVSLTHELYSYAGEAALHTFLENIFRHTKPGGVYINLDVVGPEHGDRPVQLLLRTNDGKDHGEIKTLSTAARFDRFVKDFRAEEGEAPTAFTKHSSNDTWRTVELALSDACEFIEKKDYTDSWESEMHERFCFLDLPAWSSLLTSTGFVVSDASRAFTNEWIVRHRWEDSVQLLDPKSGKSLPWPPTTILLIAQKP